MKAVDPRDQLFLLLERPHQPMHVGSLLLLKPPAGSRRQFFREQAERAVSATSAHPPFNLQLVRKRGKWFWDTDRDFDVHAHFRRLALPQPGTMTELHALVAALHAAPLDRTKPLWEAYLIEGVEGNRGALYIKIHHALADGVSGARMLQRALSTEPDMRGVTPFWALTQPRGKKPDETGELLAGLGSLAREQVTALPRVARAVFQTVQDVAKGHPHQASMLKTPSTVLNQAIGGSRRYAAGSWKLARLRRIARLHDAKLNDIVLAMCASALRRYLIERNALPAKPLVAMVPISLRSDGSDGGNQVGLMLAGLATDVADPVKRLEAIRRSVQHAKNRYAGMTQLEILEYVSTLMTIPAVNMATGLVPTRQAFNVVISNVPGPSQTLYYEGARVEAAYPLSIVLDGQALNITCTSYGDRLEFGLLACSRNVPTLEPFLQYLDEGLTELEAQPV